MSRQTRSNSRRNKSSGAPSSQQLTSSPPRRPPPPESRAALPPPPSSTSSSNSSNSSDSSEDFTTSTTTSSRHGRPPAECRSYANAGLSLCLLKDLLKDIQQYSLGPHQFNLADHIKLKPHTYGALSVRRQVQNKFFWLKQLSLKDYNLLLVKCCLSTTSSSTSFSSPPPAAATTQQFPTPKKISPAPPQGPQKRKTSSFLKESRTSSIAVTSSAKKMSFSSPLTSSSRTKKNDFSFASFESGSNFDPGMLYVVEVRSICFVHLLFAHCLVPSFSPCSRADDVDVIDVDIFRPERNREVKVFGITDVDHGGILHNGFLVSVDGDMRDVISDCYKARLVGPNEMLIELPSMSHSFYYDVASHNEVLKSFGGLCPRMEVAQGVVRNKLLDIKTLQKKYLLLRFPEDVVLSNQHYSPKSENGEIACNIIPLAITFRVQQDAPDMMVSTTTVQWKVSIEEAEQRRVTRHVPQNQNKALAQLTKQLSEGMQFSSPSS
jgi:hypothetical protein